MLMLRLYALSAKNVKLHSVTKSHETTKILLWNFFNLSKNSALIPKYSISEHETSTPQFVLTLHYIYHSFHQFSFQDVSHSILLTSVLRSIPQILYCMGLIKR